MLVGRVVPSYAFRRPPVCNSRVACSTVSTTAPQQKVRVKSGVFKFKHFDLHHGKCAQKMGTDSMLLGAWVQPPPNTAAVLDVGTGTGVLALMMAQKTQQQRSMVHAIDIDGDAYIQALENVQQCPWPERLLVAQQSFQTWVQSAAAKYDLIITNPPYFLASSKPNASSRAAARHADVLLPFQELAAGASRLLQPAGRLCLILPTVEAAQFAAEAAQQGLLLTRLMRVRTKSVDPEPKRHIMQFELTASVAAAGPARAACTPSSSSSTDSGSTAAAPAVEELVVMQQQLDPVSQQHVHVYSEQYRQLTADFHHPSMFQRG